MPWDTYNNLKHVDCHRMEMMNMQSTIWEEISSKNGNINLKTFEVLQFFLCDYTRHIRNDILNTCTLKDKCYHPLPFFHVVGLDFSA